MQPGSELDDPVALRATKHIRGVPQGCRVERCHAPADAADITDHAVVRALHDRLRVTVDAGVGDLRGIFERTRTVSLDDDGLLIEITPDGSRRRL